MLSSTTDSSPTTGAIWCGAFAPDGADWRSHPCWGLLLVAGCDNIIPSSSQSQPFQHVALGTPLVTYRGHDTGVWTVAWSPDSTRIASGADSRDPTVQVWDATNGNTLSTYRGHTNIIWTVAWSPDNQRFASGDKDGTVQVWNAADARQIYVYKGHSKKVNQVAWSPDGTRIASASDDGTVQIWGAGT